jgi:hypothetical protein
MILTSVGAMPEPFRKKHGLALSALTLAGDLRLIIPVTEIRLDENRLFRIYLDHEMETRDYSRQQSRFVLRPLVTSICRVSQKCLAWTSPSGELFEFDQADPRSLVRKREVLTRLVPELDMFSAESFEQKGVVLYADALDRWHLVEDNGWALLYMNGSLATFWTPEGSRFEVTARGERIVSISQNGRNLIRVTWWDDGPQTMTVSGQEYGFLTTPSRLLLEVRSHDAIIATLKYSAGALLKECDWAGGSRTTFEWAENSNAAAGDSRYVKSHRLLRAGDEWYEYEVRNDGVFLAAIRDGKRRESFVELNAGGISRVHERDR